MFDLLPERVPWFIVGPGLGLCIVGLFMLTNQPLGASGAYVHTSRMARRLSGTAVWRVWYFVGMFVGGLLVTQILRDGAEIRSGYDALRDAFPLWAVVPMVFVGATLLGYGAGMAGGCTSGHGICGLASLKLPSLLAVLTFMATAFLAAHVVLWMGGQ